MPIRSNLYAGAVRRKTYQNDTYMKKLLDTLLNDIYQTFD